MRLTRFTALLSGSVLLATCAKSMVLGAVLACVASAATASAAPDPTHTTPLTVVETGRKLITNDLRQDAASGNRQRMRCRGRAGDARRNALVTDACNHLLPNGATVYHPSGEVYVDGKLTSVFPDADCAALQAASGSGASAPASDAVAAPDVAQPDGCYPTHHVCTNGDQCCGPGISCAYPAQQYAGNPDGGLVCCGEHKTPCAGKYDCCAGHECGWAHHYCYNDFWAAEIQADAGSANAGGCRHLQLPREFQALSVSIQVPHAPTAPDYVDDEVFFDGLGGNGVLLQPILEFAGGSNSWLFYSEAWGGWDDTVPSFPTTVGDTISMVIYMTAGGGGSETWVISTEDEQTHETTRLTEVLSGYAPFSEAYLGVLEVHGLGSCAGLPPDEAIQLNFAEATEALDSAHGGPATGCTVDPAWVGTFDTPNWPSCLWATAVSGEDGALYWSTSP